MLEVLKGNIVHLPKFGQYETIKKGYLVLEDGVIQGTFETLPEYYANAEIKDYGDKIITQAFCDLHLHAPQFPMMGMGLDLPLLDWLNTYTFKTESTYKDTDFARRVYRSLAKELIRQGTTRVSIFSSLHREGTLILMEELEKAGITGYAGKVNMDRNSQPCLEESTEESREETLRWLEECKRFTGIKPILTPRFTPSCTDELMAFLGKLAVERNLPVQSHLSENTAEIAWVKELHPDCEEYWETYAKYGMFKPGTIMAHCVYSSEREMTAMRENGVVVAHCPDSNINICSGFPPVRKLLDAGVKVTLGSDIAGGAELPIYRTITSAVRMSNARRIASGWTETALTPGEAAYLGTSAGAEYFGCKPGFAKGDKLHALVLDDSNLPEPARELELYERYERLLYLMTAENIVARYAEGRPVG